MTRAWKALIIAAWGVAAARGQTNTTVITSDELEFDYKHSIATFDRNVTVVDPQMTMKADKMVITFDSTNSVKSVTATGNVRLQQLDKSATCAKAVYTAQSGEIRLTGSVVVQRATDTLATEDVSFWVTEERMQCHAPSKLVITQPAEGGLKPKAGRAP
jgi:lipopolysaccharide transport protein LptA